jgi:predicted membrane-bound spermidine synthase
MISGRKPFLAITFGLFFLSGIAGLIYESIWTQYLKLFLGHAAYAQTLVLIIYMGGMAIGSWLASINSSRFRNMLAAYAIAELVIGLSALIFHPVFTTYVSFTYNTVFPSFHSVFITSMYKWITASFLILPQTILLGATFPLMTGGLIRQFKDSPGHTIAVLYFVNSLGGSLGVMLSGFYLIPRFTLPGTVTTAGIIDIIIAVIVLLLSSKKSSENGVRKKIVKKDASEKKSSVMQPTSQSVAIDRTTKLMLAFTFGTAASSFIYEIGWIRMLALVLGSSTHAFELMLATFILGIALGGFFIRKYLDKSEKLISLLAVVQVLMGIFAIATLVFYSKLFYLMRFIMASIKFNEQGYIMYNVYSQFICSLVMLPASICIGMTLPVITSLLYKNTNEESVIGKVYALNTVGSIVGVVLTIHILMPFAGLKGVIITGGTIDIIIGFLILWFFKGQISFQKKVILPIAGTAMSLSTMLYVHPDPIILSSGVFRHGEIFRNRKMVSYRDGKTSSVAVHREKYFLSLSVNGKVDASVGLDSSSFGTDEFTQLLLAVYPLSYSSKTSEIGIVGLGSGMTAATMLKHEQVQSVDIVEIEPYVVDAAKLMGPKVAGVFNDKRSHIFIEDARSFFSTRNKKYDIIVSEPSNPWVSGVSNLFTKEYFSLIRKHLTTNGMLTQWFHLYEMSPDLLASVLKSLGSVFTDYKIFITGSDIVILASDTPITSLPVNDLTRNPWFSSVLKMMYINNRSDLLINYLGPKSFFEPFWEAFTIAQNSDYNPVLDLRAAKARILDNEATMLSMLTTFTIPVRKMLYGDSTYASSELSFKSIPLNRNTKEIITNRTAQQIYYYISTIGTPEEAHADSIVPGEAAMAVAKIRMTAQDRSVFARRPLAKWSLDLITATMPYLSNQQMKTIWTYIDKYIEHSMTSESSTEVLRMLKSLTYEDYTEVIETSQNVLAQRNYSDSEPSRLALTALLLSCMKLNNYDPIIQIWNKIKWRNSLDIMQQILCAIGAEKSGGIISPVF